jgi:hypothetical protein
VISFQTTPTRLEIGCVCHTLHTVQWRDFLYTEKGTATHVNRPSRLPHFLDKLLTNDGEVVSLTSRPLFAPGRFLVLISVKDWVDPRVIVRLEGLGQLKNPMTSLGFEPATFRLVALCLNQLRYRVPPFSTQ